MNYSGGVDNIGAGEGQAMLLNININYWFIFFVLLLGFFVLLAISIRLWRNVILKNRFRHQDIFLVRLPKEKSEEEKREFNSEEIHEEIAKAETVFSAIAGLRAQRGFKTWFTGRNDNFSFEIVANNKKISFYVSTPEHLSRYLEQQIHAYYPEASVEKVEDYNIFHAQGVVLAGIAKPKRSFVFPIKTYRQIESADPMNSLVNAMSKLNENESMALQLTVRSAKPGWHLKVSKLAKEVRDGKDVKEALGGNTLSKIFSGIESLFKQKDTPQEQTPRQLSPMEEEMLKNIEQKNSKGGLNTNLRIIVNAKNKGQAQVYLDNMSNALGEYSHYEYGNSFKTKLSTKMQGEKIRDFIYRRFSEKHSFLLNTEEAASIFHFPLRHTETPNISWLTAKHAPAPSNIPDEGIVLGENVYRGTQREVRYKREDRRRHTYIMGKSGVGKSCLIANMAVQDIKNGEGVGVLDPHGDLIDDILKRIPPERAEDVILFSPGDTERPLGLNLIEYDERYPEQKTFVINEIIKIFDKLYDLKSTGGPMFEQYMRNALLLIMSHPSSGSTLLEVPRVLADPDFRAMKLDKCNDQTVVDFWRKQAEKAGGEAALANIVPYITSKLTQFVSNDLMRPIIGQQESSFNIRDVMDNQKIILINLSKGRVGEMNAFLLGLILVGKVLMSALSRTDMPEKERKDFYLYIDEFQNFTTDSVNTVLSEARKYGLNLIMAHQYLGQLVKNNDTSIKDAVFGNAGTWISFKMGMEDAEQLEREYSPVFSQYDLINIEKYTAYVKLLVDNTASRPFSMHTFPLDDPQRQSVGEKIKSLSRLKYGRDRNIVESEIGRRIKDIM